MSVLFGYAESGHEVAVASAPMEVVLVEDELLEVEVEVDESVELSDAAHGSVALGSNDAG